MIARPRWKKVLADLFGNPTRSLLVVASITVGLFALGVIATLYAVISRDMRVSYAAVQPANIYIQTSLFDRDLLDTLEKLDGVQNVEGVRIASLRALNSAGQWKAIDMISYPDLGKMSLNQVRLAAGTWPPGDGEMVVEQHNLADVGAALGEMVTIERPSGKVRKLKLVGVVLVLSLGAFSGGGGFFDSPVEGFVTTETMDLLEQSSPELFSGVYIRLAAGGDNPQVVRAAAAQAAQVLEDNGVTVISNTTRATTEHPNGYLVNAIVGVLLVLGLLVLFLSGFLITNTLQALLNQQMQQIGIMKTIGARRVQITGIYVLLILGFSAIAYAIAQPLAHVVSFALLRLIAVQLNFILQGEQPVWWVMAMQAALALLMPQAAAWLPVWNGARVSVQEALSGTRKDEIAHQKQHRRSGAAQRAHPHRLRLLSRPLLISLRNTFRRKGRLALTLITLTLGGAVFIATFNVQVSLDKYIELIHQYFLADVSVSLDQPYRTVEIEALLKDVPGVAQVEGWGVAQAELIQEDGSAGESVSLLAPPAGSSLIRPVLLKGRWIEPGDENAIVLNELFTARFPGLKVGDQLALRVNGEDTRWVVVGLFQFAGKNGGYTAYTSYDYLSQLVNAPYKARMFEVAASQPGLSAKEQDRLAKVVGDRLAAAGVTVTELSTSAYTSDIISGGFMVLVYFLLFLAALTALVGSIGLAGTMSMNVMERTREIGIMRAIGASDKILMRMVLTEGLLIGLISYVLGAILSFPISKVMADQISLAVFEAPSDFGFTLLGFIIWLVAVLVLSFLASVLPARSAARLTIREVLAYE